MQDSHAEIPCKELLAIMVERGGTDLLLSVGQAPQIRVDKTLRSLDYDHLTPEKSKELCYQVMNEDQQKTLEDNSLHHIDF
jgi:twitching motility protein PilT